MRDPVPQNRDGDLLGHVRDTGGIATNADVPRLTSVQFELLELIESIANDPAFRLDMGFEPGDIQFLKNSTILHCRSEYEDFDDPDLKREQGNRLLRSGEVV